MKTSALRFAAIAALVVGFAVTAAAQTKTVLTTLKKSAWTDSVATASSVAMTASQPYSFTAFFKIDPAHLWGGSVKYMAKIIGDGATMLGVYTSDGVTKLAFMCHNNQYNYYTLTLCDAPTDGAWHHAAVTVASANSCIFYLDGEAVYTGTAKIGYKESSPVSLCVNKGNNSSNSGGFGGSLAEVSMWNRVLSAEEVLAMKAGRPDSTALNNGCLGFWPLDDEPDQTTAADLLGVRDLTISSTAVFNFTTTDDFPEYKIGDATVYVPINRLYPTNRVTVTIGEGASMKNDMFEKDTEVTFTATADGAPFVRWYGDVPDDQIRNPTITILADQEKTIVPYFAYDWLYDPATKKMSDEYWTINMVVSSGTNLKLSHPAASRSMPLVDLTKAIVDAEENPYAVIGVYMYGSSYQAFMGNTVIGELRLPNTMTSMDASLNVNWDRGAFMDCVNLKKVTPFIGDYLTSVGEHVFYGCTSLEGELVLGGGASECVLLGRRETQSGKSRDNGHHFAGTKITGVTTKANIHDLPYAVFSGCSALSNVVFEAGSITNIAASAFANCKKVTDFAMPERPEGIADNAFGGWTARQCRFVIHASEPRWAAYLADSANFTPWGELDADTKAAYRAKFGRGRKPMGLSLTLPANQWIVSDQDPGFTVLVR